MRVGARLENSCPLESFAEGGIDPQLVPVRAGWGRLVKVKFGSNSFRDHVSTASSVSIPPSELQLIVVCARTR
jgi:hypothetical protein